MSKKINVLAITIISLAMVFSSALFCVNDVFAADHEAGGTYTISKDYQHQTYEINPPVANREILRGPIKIKFSTPTSSDKAYVILDGSTITLDNRMTSEFDADYEVMDQSMYINTAFLMLRKLPDRTIIVNEAEGGTASVDKVIANLRTTINLTATSAEGYEFVSWDVKDASGTSISVTDNSFSMPDADVTVTPVFRKIPEYTVSFDSNGGSGTMESATIREGEEYTLPECGFTAPAGKEFDKWDKGAAGSKIAVTEDTVVKAQWKDVPSEAGTDTDSDSKIDNDSESETKANTPSKTDKGSQSDSETKDSTSPKTGDESDVMFWSVLMIISLGILTGLGIIRKRD